LEHLDSGFLEYRKIAWLFGLPPWNPVGIGVGLARCRADAGSDGVLGILSRPPLEPLRFEAEVLFRIVL